MSSNYETLYGVGFLDDLHNYFPALLYDSSSFGSVRELLGYIQQQARNRFDLFSYGQREYLSTHPQAPSVPSFHSVRTRTSFASMPANSVGAGSTLPPRLNPVTLPSLRSLNTVTINESQSNIPLSTITQTIGRPTSIQVDLRRSSEAEEEEEEEEEEQETQNESALITNALLSLLQLPVGGLTRTLDINAFGQILANRNRNMDQFLQPVVVHPTPEQIANNTTVGNLVSDTEHACAICQDNLTEEQEGRKLNACGHWFHKNCIDTWLERDVHCPVCRHDIREPLRRENSPPVPSD